MQLYHLGSIHLTNGPLRIQDDRVLHHMKRVMRNRPGDRVVFQCASEGGVVRYTCVLHGRDQDAVLVDVEDQCVMSSGGYHHHLVVAMANKRDKIELIVQKATECGVGQITIVPMHRSVIRQYNAHKWSRLQAIVTEAVEQSWGSCVPMLSRCDTLHDVSYGGSVLLAQLGGTPLSHDHRNAQCTMIIGPEGGIDQYDLDLLDTCVSDIQTISLGSTVLRMETAAIVAGWRMGQECNSV